jgi:hypothetical protein
MQTRGENRNGHEAGIQATPECGDEIESGRVKKQGAISRCGLWRKRRGYGASTRFQFHVSDARFFGLAVGKITECYARAMLRSSCAEQFHQVRKARVTVR